MGGGPGLALTSAPDEKRGELLGTAFGAAVVGALFGPVVGWAAIQVGTGPAFSAASIAGVALMAAAFAVPPPKSGGSQALRQVLPALRDPRLAYGMWLMALAGIAFGVTDVLAPLRLGPAGRQQHDDRGHVLVRGGHRVVRVAGRGEVQRPVRGGAPGADRPPVGTVFGVLAWLPGSVPWLIAVLVLGMPFFGALYTPAAAMVSESAQDQNLNHGIAFALTNLTWAAGQAIAAAGSGALAEATSDAVPYLLLGAACLATLCGMLRTRPPGSPGASPEAD